MRRMRQFCTIVCNSITLVAALTGPAAGQVELYDGEIVEGLILRGVAELPAASRIAFAEASEPLWVMAEDSNSTLTSIVETQCGVQPPEAYEFLIEQGLAFNAIEDADTPFAPGDAVAVPFCFRVDEMVPVTVQTGDTPSGILKREYGVFGPRTTQRFFELNRGTTYPNAEAFANALQPGDEVILPFTAERRLLNPRLPRALSLKELYAGIPERSVRDQISMSVMPVRNDAERGRFRLHYVDLVEFSGTDHSVACNGSAGQTAEIVDSELLRTRFEAETKRLAERLGMPDADLLPATVGVVDSGLSTIGDDFFDQRFFLPNRSELLGVEGVDEDDNGLNDDIYGRNYYSRTEHGVVTPLPGMQRAAHGTKMAALVLGGIDLAPSWTINFEPPVVQLKVISFVDGDPMNFVGTASPVELPGAIKYLEKMQANIVNLSLVTEERIALLKNSVRDADGLLFVVAAGNARSGPGRDLRTFELYPARFGGDRGEPNLVTVAAHDLSGVRAGFSNFSDKHVDLLAPGCAVRTRTDRGEIVLDSGTSPATAIVSFTAALVRALGLQQPGRIKMRLLAGTDFDPALSEDAYASGRLNVIKAISLYHDVVELRDGSPLLFGLVQDHLSLIEACEDALPVVAGTLHKVVANVGGSASLEIWSEIDQELIRSACTQSGDGFTVTFENEAGTRQIPIDDIKEIIFGTGVAR